MVTINENYGNLVLLRKIAHHLDMLTHGEDRGGREFLTLLEQTFPDSYHRDPHVRLLMRDLGLWPHRHLDYLPGAGYYRTTESCQIPYLAEIYEDIFGQKSDGWFVEAGAFNGDTYSNTSFLADLGWHGLYIEPIREYHDMCRFRHRHNPNVRMVEGGLSDRLREIELKLAAMSTSALPALQNSLKDQDYARDWSQGDFRRAFAYPLDFLLENAGFPPAFDLLVLDVEGGELEALQGLDLNRWQPRMIIIELLDDHPEFGAIPELRTVGLACRDHLSRWYEDFWRDDSNTILLRR